MNNIKHRFLTLLLAFVMLFTTLPLNVFAASGVSGEKNEITDIKTVGDKQVINLGEVQGKSSFGFFSGRKRLFGARTQQARSSSETVPQKVEIKLDTNGLNLEDPFDQTALDEVYPFDVTIKFVELGVTNNPELKLTFSKGETVKSGTIYLPKNMGQGKWKAEIPKLDSNINLRVFKDGDGSTNFNDQGMTYTFELTQIVHPVIDLKVVDPYGKELKESINQDLGLKLSLLDDHEFDLPANTKTLNIRSLDDFAGDNVVDLNDAGDNPTLSLTTELDANKRLTVGDKTYKLNKITYNALGQEVVINDKTEKVGGYIEFATQPKIVVPTPDENGDLPNTPDGYKRLSFHAESSSNAQDGRFEHGDKLKVIDVLEGTEYTDEDLQKEIKGIGQPTPLINGGVDDSKKFLKWNPALPTTGKVDDTDYWPVYLKDGGEITPGEKLPDGVFEVKVIKDDTIAEDALYGKSYGVFQGSKLARDKFPDLVAAKGHQNPKWTTEADEAEGMVEIAKPWTKVITKATTFKATAGEDAATQIGKDGLKAVDTTALQGQDLTEAFWHKGVALAENTPADKKDAFAALLKDATVTDKSSRTTDAEGTFPGTLLVTFKDGSTLEVEKQNLIVKPNTVTVEFDKAEGKEHPLRDGDTTVKGKISASSNSDEFPVSLDGALVTIKKGDTVLSRTLANEDGSFVAGVKEPLVAGEDISVVVTLPGSKTASKPVTEKVQLNPDKLNEIIPMGNEVVKNFEGKQGVNQDKVKALKDAIKKATDDLVEKDGKVKSTVKVDATGQKSLDDQYEAIKKAIEALTGNTAPEITGTSHKEIFKGDALDLEEGITVTDKDGETDIALQDGKKFTYTVEKIGEKGAKEAVKDTTTINQTPGTYEVTYTAKDKSGAEGTFVMTLVVKNDVIEVPGEFPEDDKIPEGYVKVEFKEGAHGKLEGTTKFLVKKDSKNDVLNAPKIVPNANYEAKKDANWDPTIPATFAEHFETTAQYTYKGDDVVEQKPGEDKPDVPENFVKVEFKKGDHGVISSEESFIYWVNPDAGKTLADIKKPAVTAFEGYKFTGWDKADTTAIGADGLTVTAQYKALVVEGEDQPTKPDPENPGETIPDTDYAKLTFVKGDKGEFVENAKTTIWVLKNEEVSFNAPQVKANDGFVFNGWDPALQTKYTEDKTHTAKYESKSDISDVPVAGFQEVKFLPGTDGKFEGEKQEKSVWVRPDVEVNLTTKAPKVIADEGKVHTGWEPSLIGTFTKSDTPTEITAQYKTDADNNGIADEDEKTPEPDVLARNIGENPDKTTVEVETEPKAKVTIEYTDKDGQPQKVENLTAGEDGKLTQEITPMLKDGTDVKVTVQDGEKKPADKTVKVFDDVDNNRIPDDQAGQTERPAALASNIGKAPTFTTITGEAEKGATVTAYVGNQVVGTATADKETGKYTIEAKQNGAPIKQGVKVDVTATLKPKTESFKQTVVVFNDTDGTGQPDSAKDFDVKKAKEMQVISSPEKMVYNDGDQLNLDGLKVLITDVNGNQKIFTYNSKDNTEFTKAGLTVDYKQGVQLTSADNGKKLTVTLDTKDNKEVTEAITGETPTSLTVNKNQSAQPTDVVAANQGDEKVTKVKGKAVKGAEVKITDASGNSLLPEGTTLKAGDNGEFEAKLSKLLDPGTKVFVTATEPGKTESPKAETTVIRDKDGDWKADTGAKLSTPVIDPIREKDEKVVVGVPKADDKIKTIEVSDQNGNTVTLTKDATGNTWTVVGSDPAVKVTEQGGKIEIPVKDKLPLNDRDQIKVTFKDGENPANEAFDKAPVQKASQTPKVDPVYTGDKSVKIADPTVADPTAKTIKVKVNDNDSMTVEKQPDGSWKVKEDPNKEVKVEDGKIVVPLDPSAKKDDVIKVSTINDSGKASPAAEVKVVDKVETQKPTIDRANKDENSVSGTAAPGAEVTVTVTPKGGEPKTFTGKADGDGNYKVTTDPLVDGDTVVVKASEPGKADNTSDPKVVGVDTSKLQESIDKAEDPAIGGKDGANLDENKPIDKALKDALEKGKDVKKKGDQNDPNTDQNAVDKAKEELDKAIAQKEADKAVDKAKDNPTPENIGQAQDKIDAIPGSTDPSAPDYNEIKKDLQDKLDLIKKIKEGEDRLKQPDIKDKLPSDVEDLENAVKEGKKAIESTDSKTITDATKSIEKAIEQINKERIKVSIDSVAVGIESLFIRTSVPNVTVVIKIDGVKIDTITTDGFGTFAKSLDAKLEGGQKIILEAKKDGYNDGTFRTKVSEY